jgi:hypothetical protein
MSSYEAMASSNYFRVRDLRRFRTAVAATRLPLRIESAIEGGDILLRLTCEAADGWPKRTADGWYDFDVADFVAPHLADGWVAIFEEIGHETSRYVNGYAVAVNNLGQKREVGLYEINDLAKQLGEHITVAS